MRASAGRVSKTKSSERSAQNAETSERIPNRLSERRRSQSTPKPTASSTISSSEIHRNVWLTKNAPP
jgi:hypothetical protein